MAFVTGDRAKLVRVLQLHKDQAKENSILDMLMDEAERFDTANATTYVADIQAAIVAIDALDTQIVTASEQDGITRIEEFQIYQIDRKAGAATAPLINQRHSKIALIKRLLDPENYLDQFATVGRVIRTL